MGDVMEALFFLFLAGCTDDLQLCRPLAAGEEAMAGRATCEAALDLALAAPDPEWPVLLGSCEPGSADRISAAPDWFPGDAIAGLRAGHDDQNLRNL